MKFVFIFFLVVSLWPPILVESEKTNPVLAAQISVHRGLSRDLARARANFDQTFNATSRDNSTLFAGLTWHQLSALKPNISIDPPLLQFGSQALCIPAASTFEIINICDTEVEVFSVTGNNAQFHTTKFGSTILEPSQKAAVRVVFLPRQVGVVRVTFVIKTSVGKFLYEITGSGIPSPYNVEPLEARVPIGVLYEPPIRISNYLEDTELHVKEIFTTEGFLQLALPPGVQVDPNGRVSTDGAVLSTEAALKWIIPNRSTHEVIHLSFKSHTPGQYQGYVHVKTDMDNMVIPVDITVLPNGLHTMPEVIDFGILASGQKRTRLVTLYNSMTSPVALLDMGPRESDNSVVVDFSQTLVLPDYPSYFNVTYKSAPAGENKMGEPVTGTLLIRTNRTSESVTKIKYKAMVLDGSLEYNASELCFLIEQEPMQDLIPRSVKFTNNFSVPLTFEKVILEDTRFQVLSAPEGKLALPGKAWPAVNLMFNRSNLEQSSRNVTMLIQTNSTIHEVNIELYHGMLVATVEHNKGKQTFVRSARTCMGDKCPSHVKNTSADGGGLFLDFGTVAVNQTRKRILNLTNPNPVPVKVIRISKSWRTIHLRLAGIYRYGMPQDINESKATAGNGLFVLQPRASSTFVVLLRAPLRRKTSSSDSALKFYTSSGFIRVGAKYKSVTGSITLVPSTLEFDPAFPGSEQSKPLFATSTFEGPVTLLGLSSHDLRIVPITNVSILQPNVRTRIGEIVFAPGRECPHSFACLEKLPCEKEDSDDVKNHVVSVRDVLALQKREQIWSQRITSGETSFRTKVTLETDIVSGTELHVKAALKRPEFVDSPLQFQLTQLLTTSSKMLHVRNPARVPVTMRLMTTSDNQVMHDGFLTIPIEGRKEVIVPEFGELDLGPIEFRPSLAARYATKVYIRNNLTGLYPVDVKGMGGSGDLVMLVGENVAAEDAAESDGPIKFRLNISHVTKPQWGMTKIIRALNRGNLALEIKGMMLNSDVLDESFLCKHGGFEIMDCSELSFTLLPNEAREFEVSFTPDCSMSEVEQQLTIMTSVGPFSRIMTALIPQEVMKPCYNEARSRWRAEMGWAWTIWSLALLAVVVAVLTKLAFAIRSYLAEQAKAKTSSVTKKGKTPRANKADNLRDDSEVRKPKGATATKVSTESRKKRKKKTSPNISQQKHTKSSAPAPAPAPAPAASTTRPAKTSTPAPAPARGGSKSKNKSAGNKTAEKQSKKLKNNVQQPPQYGRQSKIAIKTTNEPNKPRRPHDRNATSKPVPPAQIPVQSVPAKKPTAVSGFKIVDNSKPRGTAGRAGRSGADKVSRSSKVNATSGLGPKDTKARKTADRSDKKEKEKKEKERLLRLKKKEKAIKVEEERLLRLKKKEKAIKAEEERKKLQKEFDALKKQQQEKRKEKKLKKDKNKKRIDTTTTAKPVKTNSAWTLPQSRKKSSAFAASMDTKVEKTYQADGQNRRNWDSSVGAASSKKSAASGWNKPAIARSKPAFSKSSKSKPIAAPISKPTTSPGMLFNGTNRKRLPSHGTIGIKPMPTPIGVSAPKVPVRGAAATPIGGSSNLRPTNHTWDSYDDGSNAGASWSLSSIRQQNESSSNFGAIGGGNSRAAGVIGGRPIGGSRKPPGLTSGVGLFNPRGAAHPPGMFGGSSWTSAGESTSAPPPGFGGWSSSSGDTTKQLFGSSLFSSNPSSMFSDEPGVNANSNPSSMFSSEPGVNANSNSNSMFSAEPGVNANINPSSMFSGEPGVNPNSNSNSGDGFDSLWSTPWRADTAAAAGTPAPAPADSSPEKSSGRVLESFFASDADGYGDFSGGALEDDDS